MPGVFPHLKKESSYGHDDDDDDTHTHTHTHTHTQLREILVKLLNIYLTTHPKRFIYGYTASDI